MPRPRRLVKGPFDLALWKIEVDRYVSGIRYRQGMRLRTCTSCAHLSLNMATRELSCSQGLFRMYKSGRRRVYHAKPVLKKLADGSCVVRLYPRPDFFHPHRHCVEYRFTSEKKSKAIRVSGREDIPKIWPPRGWKKDKQGKNREGAEKMKEQN